MVYIFNKYIAPRKTIKVALTEIFGVGSKTSQKITNSLRIHPNHRFWKLDSKTIVRLTKYISTHFLVNVALKKTQLDNINRMIQMKTYRGIRHSKGLPVRGQQTRRNAKTQKKLSAKVNAQLNKDQRKKNKK